MAVEFEAVIDIGVDIGDAPELGLSRTDLQGRILHTIDRTRRAGAAVDVLGWDLPADILKVLQHHDPFSDAL